MTSNMLGWFAAGICTVAFVILWFSLSFRELSAKRKSLDIIYEQVQMHRRLYMQERGGEYDVAAQNILASKLMVYREVEKDYNALLKTPMHRIPAFILRFHLARKENML
ncbi:hypothetical protein CS063_10535 [Sporanaerobium hydrogeniformans]|uniref:Uncharacterized protein n=1 Tax=Sporanaerobium hydrogeniformans TaxID=3072179 RepID=A0AC61DB91_9FIRM|nr:hypothetical protein [Sporanaerobium hydrogeniformans]PHV70515.1 hypothetical protein CS063_10535 [Sporanaerobium hydrogeniformans]